MIKKIFLLLVFFVFSSVASAERIWVSGVTINEVGEFSRESSGTTYQVLYVRSDDLKGAGLGCDPTDVHGVVSATTTSSFSSNHQMRYSALLSAQAQGLKVDLLLQPAECNTSSLYSKNGAPYGRGIKIYGVVINP